MLLRTCLAYFFALSSGLASAGIPQPAAALEAPGSADTDSLPSLAQWPSQSSTYTLRGTVVNSVTGEAVGGSLVQINSGIPRSLLTGPDGKFVFDGMPEGPTSLLVRKPGFFAPDAIPNSIPSPQAPVIVAPDMPPVILKLIPEGLIYGRISGSDGEPLEDFPVFLLVERVENGKTTQEQFGQNLTTSEGEFRFANLPPGMYFLFAGPSPAPEPIPAALSPQGYPISFYPGVPDLASATAIEITPGRRMEVDLAPPPTPFYRLSGTVSGYSPGYEVNLQVYGGGAQFLAVGVSFDSLKGSFQTGFLPSGPCSITAHALDPKTQQSLSASRSVNLTSDLTGIHLTLLPGVTIPVNVHVETTRNDRRDAGTGFSPGATAPGEQQEIAPVQVVLSAGGGLAVRTQYSAAFSGNPGNRFFALQNVDPGVYTVQIIPNGLNYPHSASSASVDLLRNELTVSPGGAVAPIEIVLRDDFANLSGKVRGAAKNAPSTVLLFPESSTTATRFESTSTDGSFDLAYLPPGAYKLLAFDPFGDLDYTKPAILQKYMSHAREVTLAPSQSAQIDLDLLRPGD